MFAFYTVHFLPLEPIGFKLLGVVNNHTGRINPDDPYDPNRDRGQPFFLHHQLTILYFPNGNLIPTGPYNNKPLPFFQVEIGVVRHGDFFKVNIFHAKNKVFSLFMIPNQYFS